MFFLISKQNSISIFILVGENYEEISEASQNAEDSSKNIGKKEGIQSDNEVLSVKLINNDNKNSDAFTGAGKLQHNGDKKQDESVNTSTQIVIASDGTPTEVKMRGPVRRYSTKTASFRWSGAEMIQIDGPQAVINNSEDHEEMKPDISIDPIQKTRMNIGYKKTNVRLEKKLTSVGFSRSPTFTELPKDGDNCFKALLDQMSQPNQDFKVWEKDDFSFLRWYIIKQLEIQVAAGRTNDYVQLNSSENLQDYMSTIQKEESFVDNYYLYSVSKIFNKDIVIVDSSENDNVTYLKGGQNGSKGKGEPLYLAHLRKEEAGENYYQSIIPDETCNIDVLLSKSHIL